MNVLQNRKSRYTYFEVDLSYRVVYINSLTVPVPHVWVGCGRRRRRRGGERGGEPDKANTIMTGPRRKFSSSLFRTLWEYRSNYGVPMARGGATNKCPMAWVRLVDLIRGEKQTFITLRTVNAAVLRPYGPSGRGGGGGPISLCPCQFFGRKHDVVLGFLVSLASSCLKLGRSLAQVGRHHRRFQVSC